MKSGKILALLRFIANGFAATFDWCMGVVIVHFIAQSLGYEVSFWHYTLGAILGITPDFDFVFQLKNQNRSLVDHHDSLAHRPLFGLLCAFALGYLLGGEFWAITAPLCTLCHYLHDTRGLGGGGIAWMWPLSSQHFGLSGFTNPREAVLLWPNHTKWLDEEYLRPSKRSLTELAGSSLGLAIVIWQTIHPIAGMLILISAWMLAISLWLTFRHIQTTR